MSEDELVVGALCLGSGVVLWSRWYYRATRPAWLGRRTLMAPLLLVTPLGCLIVLAVLLKQFAASDVRDSMTYLTWYLIMGTAWVAVYGLAWPLLGLSVRDDVVERNNSAASIHAIGAMIAGMLCYAGANFGDGPGWWVVVFCAAMSTGGLLVLWSLTAALGGHADAITVDRDPAAAVRFACWLIAVSAVLGRAVAGDWQTAEGAVEDFVRVGWPLVVAVPVEAGVQRLLPAGTDETPSILSLRGLVPGTAYLVAAALYLMEAGWW